MNRRQFLAAAVAAPALSSEGELPVIDTHQHLWDLQRFRLPWIKEGSPLARNCVMADYRQATAGLDVVKAVYMEVDVAPEQQQAEADFVRELCRRGDSPTVAGVVSGQPSTDGFRRYAEQFRGDKYIKGIRRVLHGPQTPPGSCLKPEFVRDIRLLGDLGLSFDLCMRSAELPDAVKLIDACPGTRFILDHCGNPDVRKNDRAAWERDTIEVAKRKHVVGKVSGIVASAKPGAWSADDLAPFVNHTLDVFGPDRVMFAGDWPVCTLAATFAQWLGALKSIVRGRKLEEQRKLFHDNAVRFYGLA
jgi:predicted TIM-barrel fold metal-dependent hydrolase